MIKVDKLDYFCKKYQIDEESVVNSDKYLDYQNYIDDILNSITTTTTFTFSKVVNLWIYNKYPKTLTKLDKDLILYCLFTHDNVKWINCGCGTYGKFKIQKGVK